MLGTLERFLDSFPRLKAVEVEDFRAFQDFCSR
jgi:hypothetical protein